MWICDLPEVPVPSTAKLFADDTKLHRAIKNEEDKLQLQEALNNLQKWSEKWQLPFNVEKCKVLHLGPHNEEYNYTLKSGIIEIWHKFAPLGSSNEWERPRNNIW